MKKKTDLFGDNVRGSGSEDDFESMLNASMGLGGSVRRSTGDRFSGEILSIGKEESFVSTGTPVDGNIPTRELRDETGELKFKVGDKVDVIVVRSREGELFLKRAQSTQSSADVESLEDAFDMELPIEGRVSEIVKGGFRVQVMGKPAFCPISQMDLRPGTDQNEHLDKKYDFIITQFENKGRNIVVSRRKLLELQRAEIEGNFLNDKKPGDIVGGIITRMEKFGAFMRLDNGLEGLVPISELAWGRVGHPEEVVRIGQSVDAKILKMEEEGDRVRISLSIKQGGGQADPWLMISQTFPIGKQVEGTIDKKEQFGFFVVLAPGINGLLPKSKYRDSTSFKEIDNKKKGDKILVQIDQVLPTERKISLGLAGEASDESWRSHTASGSGGTAGKNGLGTMADLFNKARR